MTISHGADMRIDGPVTYTLQAEERWKMVIGIDNPTGDRTTLYLDGPLFRWFSAQPDQAMIVRMMVKAAAAAVGEA